MNSKFQSLPSFEPRVLQGFELDLVSGAAVTNGNYSTGGTYSGCYTDGTNDDDKGGPNSPIHPPH